MPIRAKGQSNLGPHKHQQGVALVMTVVALTALIGVTGMALDTGHVLLTQTRMQSLVDAATLSGAKTLQQTDNTALAAAEAIDTFVRPGLGENASSSEYKSIKNDYDSGDLTLSISFSKTLDPFIAGSTPAVYIRVVASTVTLSTSLLKVLNIHTLQTDASAIAGPTPSLVKNVCDIAPFMMCGDEDTNPDDDQIYGYNYDQPTVIKIGAGQDSAIGSGNFQLIQVGGPGGDVVRDAAAGVESAFCLSKGDGVNLTTVETQTGNTVGPVVQGLNTRFGEYRGAANQYSDVDFPADFYSTEANPPLDLDDDGNLIVDDGSDTPVQESIDNHNLLAQDGYHQQYVSAYGSLTSAQESQAGYQRRIITVPVGQCNGAENGQHTADIWGFACVYLPQKVVQKGNDAHVYAQVVKGCTTPGGFSVNPVSGPEPTTIVLHKNPNDDRS